MSYSSTLYNPCCQSSGQRSKDSEFSNLTIQKTLNACQIKSKCANVSNLRALNGVIGDLQVDNLTIINQPEVTTPPMLVLRDMVGFVGTLAAGPNSDNLFPIAQISFTEIVQRGNISWFGNTITIQEDGFYIFVVHVLVNISSAPGGQRFNYGLMVNGSATPLVQNTFVYDSANMASATQHVIVTFGNLLSAGDTLQLGRAWSSGNGPVNGSITNIEIAIRKLFGE